MTDQERTPDLIARVEATTKDETVKSLAQSNERVAVAKLRRVTGAPVEWCHEAWQETRDHHMAIEYMRRRMICK